MHRVVWTLIVLLLILHQDNWFWSDNRQVFGFIPIGLFYHACISLAAGATWYMATRFCWPTGLDDEASEESPA